MPKHYYKPLEPHTMWIKVFVDGKHVENAFNEEILKESVDFWQQHGKVTLEESDHLYLYARKRKTS